MSVETNPDAVTRPPWFRRRGSWWLAGGIVAVLVLGSAALATSAPKTGPGKETSRSASVDAATPSAGAKERGASAPDAKKPGVDPAFGEPVAATVAHGDEADFGNGVLAKLVATTATTSTAKGVGEVSGSAVRVEVELRNTSSSAVSLDAVTVNAYIGAKRTPAPPVESSGTVTPFTGSLAPGASAHGSYVFSTPHAKTAGLVITVNVSPGAPLVVLEQ
ncbi:hypothetical protein [Parafrigoribacterium soli]|uniref:hypothetical protein n=1 Tax=Parafrigoribacterium soli TaxID=3144663 RepID=UPI0032ED90E3